MQQLKLWKKNFSSNGKKILSLKLQKYDYSNNDNLQTFKTPQSIQYNIFLSFSWFIFLGIYTVYTLQKV